MSGIVTKHLLSQAMKAPGHSNKLIFPAAERNGPAIADAIAEYLLPDSILLEVGSGSGQHVTLLASQHPEVTFQPTDIEPTYLASIEEYIAEAGLHNVLPPRPLSLIASSTIMDWQKALGGVTPHSYDTIMCSNVLHITPWEATEGLIHLASHFIKEGGHLLLYGPFAHDGVLEPESNQMFDARLREKDPLFGVRDITDIVELARTQPQCAHDNHNHNTSDGCNGDKDKDGCQLHLERVIDMPSNNKIVVFKYYNSSAVK